MEAAHPIPQNVTAFQFRLVGDMTLKQFIYLAVGMSIAYLSLVFLSSTVPILAWPVIVISGLTGVCFAFVPIADRPLDYWLGSFLKAVYSPTKRVWHKNGQVYNQNLLFTSRLAIFLQGSLAQLPATSQTSPVAQTPSKEQLPTQDELTKTVELARQAQILQEEIAKTQQELDILKQSRPAQNSVQAYAQKTSEVLENLQKLAEEGSEIKKELAEVTHQTTPLVHQPVVTILAPSKPTPTQLTLTSFPNVINGIIRDSVGNYLEGVVVVIYDKTGMPVRALKTNRLGQFSGSTPLPNGTYRIELEKDNLTFDVLQIELAGSTLPPLEISAKRLVPGS